MWPMSLELPQGWSRSLYFAEAVTGSLLSGLPSLRDSLFMSDQGRPFVIRRDLSEKTLRVTWQGAVGGVQGLVYGAGGLRAARWKQNDDILRPRPGTIATLVGGLRRQLVGDICNRVTIWR